MLGSSFPMYRHFHHQGFFPVPALPVYLAVGKLQWLSTLLLGEAAWAGEACPFLRPPSLVSHWKVGGEKEKALLYINAYIRVYRCIKMQKCTLMSSHIFKVTVFFLYNRKKNGK